ncbi:hypothetical protein JKP88DRAFT_283528 [Tribonema minus]|uniref:Uncharacterized protein n=1 Tax=Tribonema minus TaxID=303371 RepID=A0A835YHW5_9STRA|nr:hypothetical protein JKP88DRAFT_283528 [Tribonema minus]
MAAWMFNETAVLADGASCATACGRVDSCGEAWAWQAILGMMTFSSTFLFCSAICISGEQRRRRKGLTIAQAYSLPEGIPIVRASVAAAVERGRRTFRSRSSSGSSARGGGSGDGGSGDGGSGAASRERCALLAEASVEDTSAYGTLHWYGDGHRVPVAQRAEHCDFEHAYRGTSPNAPSPLPSPPPLRRASWAARATSALTGLLSRRSSGDGSGGGGGGARADDRGADGRGARGRAATADGDAQRFLERESFFEL